MLCKTNNCVLQAYKDRLGLFENATRGDEKYASLFYRISALKDITLLFQCYVNFAVKQCGRTQSCSLREQLGTAAKLLYCLFSQTAKTAGPISPSSSPPPFSSSPPLTEHHSPLPLHQLWYLMPQ